MPASKNNVPLETLKKVNELEEVCRRNSDTLDRLCDEMLGFKQILKSNTETLAALQEYISTHSSNNQEDNERNGFNND